MWGVLVGTPAAGGLGHGLGGETEGRGRWTLIIFLSELFEGH